MNQTTIIAQLGWAGTSTEKIHLSSSGSIWTLTVNFVWLVVGGQTAEEDKLVAPGQRTDANQ